MAASTFNHEETQYTVGVDVGTGNSFGVDIESFERHREVLVPPSAEQIDGYIAQYEYAKKASDEAKAALDIEKDKLVFLADHFGHPAPGADQSIRLAGLRNAARITRGSSVVIDEPAVLELQKATKSLPALFACLFSSQTTHKLLKDARKALLAVQVPQRRHEKLLAMFGKCFDVKTNAPSVKVEVIKPEKVAKKPRSGKAAA